MQIDPQNSNPDSSASEPAQPLGQTIEAHNQEEEGTKHAAADTAKLQQEIADLKDKYVRVHAEMENMRRRQERERSDLLKFGLESIFKDLLPVLDSFESAIPEDNKGDLLLDAARVQAFADGMVMVRRLLTEVCRKHGLEPISAKDSPFDPHLHQAVQRVESQKVTVDTVGSEFSRGYQLNGRLLRPAMVSVLTPTGG